MATINFPKIGETVEYVEGWGLNNPDRSAYDLRETGDYAGHCVSDTCAHNSHDPYGPVMRLTLNASGLPEAEVRPGTVNKIIFLGETDTENWYTGPRKGTVLRVLYEQHYNVYAKVISVKEAPLSIEAAYYGR